jgi:uncharacterized OB-fold protein
MGRSSGRGKVHSYSVVWRPQPVFDPPYVVAVVELEEGWFMLTNIVGCPVDQVRCDMAVGVEFKQLTPDVAVPVFRPTG